MTSYKTAVPTSAFITWQILNKEQKPIQAKLIIGKIGVLRFLNNFYVVVQPDESSQPKLLPPVSSERAKNAVVTRRLSPPFYFVPVSFQA